MIVVNVIGGLGNQMFQYAFAYSVSQKLKQPLKLDIKDFETYWYPYQLNAFHIKVKPTCRKLKLREKGLLNAVIRRLRIIRRKLFTKGYYQEPHYHFDENVFYVKGDSYFVGYWQSECYFKDYKTELLAQFTLKYPIHNQTQKYKEKILSTNAVSLHIRRGDYISNVNANNFHGVCSLEYYKKAVKHIIQISDESCFYIFSDDLDWAKKNLNFVDNKIFVELDESVPDYEEMYLMSCCQHNIVANSSFSWWGAWLNQNPDKKVVAPKQWFTDSSINTKDLIPKTWIRL